MSEVRVDLIQSMGDDLAVVNAARVSFAKESAEFSERDAGLIRYLARHGHWSPLAHTAATFRIAAPVFVARQLFKHTVGLVANEISRRYVDAAPEFYLPGELRERPSGSVKQGSGGPHPRSAEWAERIAAKHEADAEFYAAMIEDGIAPEQARAELPQATMTEWWWTGNVASFARVCRLRLAPDAQSETREVAAGISEHMGRLFPVSWAAVMGEAA